MKLDKPAAIARRNQALERPVLNSDNTLFAVLDTKRSLWWFDVPVKLVLVTLARWSALTAVLVILTGIMGALIVTPLMNALGIRDYRARGFAVGLASHGIGTARAFQVDPVAGTFAGIAIGLNALMTAVIVPMLLGIME